MVCTSRPMRAAAGNNPCRRDGTSAVFRFIPACGIWDDTPKQVQSMMSGWHSQCGIYGGFMWLYDDFVGNGLAVKYAQAINNAVSGTGFTLSGPSSVFLNQSSTASALITITPLNGFHGKVNLSLSSLPKGIRASVQSQANQRKLLFKASPSAATGFTAVTVTGTSGSIKQTLTFTLASSAAVGTTGTGTPVDLSSSFNLNGIYQDGTSYSSGGLDGLGYSYSANLLTPSRILNGVLFDFGPANQPDAVACNGQAVTLPAGQFSSLILFATGIQGNQASEILTVNYTDGTSSSLREASATGSHRKNFPPSLKPLPCRTGILATERRTSARSTCMRTSLP